jgi:hypothetical protein
MFHMKLYPLTVTLSIRYEASALADPHDPACLSPSPAEHARAEVGAFLTNVAWGAHAQVDKAIADEREGLVQRLTRHYEAIEREARK